MVEVLKKVSFDMIVQTPCVTLPIAYITKSILYKYSLQEAMRRYLGDIRNHGLLKKYWALWGPVQCVTFSIIPEHWRVTFIAVVSFFWLIILSSIASKSPIQQQKRQHSSSTIIAGEVGVKAAEKVDDECAFEDGLTCNLDG